ncbi:BufA2 family periplasmic bufferin-type metallophore [Bdellovibrio svalbardensis]|uniref:Uncharacterized protein n=1 Tax=Bdellovibrio svalbardensis TaxID=2972972 RepID=A0ABT6DFL2_9BACT|nr:hypothetical protein [Bdellovibrio svalbardensis]MDG0815639.1 hypothetical protein [Bdellovibrio svalbardensis]
MTKGTFTKAAISGLLAAGALSVSLQAHGADSQKPDAATAEGECHGVNSCKGKGDCGGKGHGCAGKNSCKGKGWLRMTKEKCEAAHGKFKADKGA